MAITTYETSDTYGRFSVGDIVRVSGERGEWLVKSFRNDRGGWTAVVYGDRAMRSFLVERLTAISKRKRVTIGAES